MAVLADSPVPFRTLHREGGRGGGDTVGWGARLAFHVGAGVPGGSPADLLPFLLHVGGTTESVTIGGVSVERIVPLRHPHFPDWVAQAVDWDRTGKAIGIDTFPGWSDWKVLVDFASVPYAFGGDEPYFTLERDYGASVITLSGQAFAVGGVKLNHDVTRNIPQIVYRATKYNVPGLDDSVYRELSGKINAAPFLGYAAKTVFFAGVQDQIVQTIAFTQNRTVGLSLACRPRLAWNSVVLPNGVVAEPVNVNDGLGIYETGNFDLLLQ
jgi:hypothetical protein